MKFVKFTLATAVWLLSFGTLIQAQDTIRCFTVEANEMLRERHPEIGNDEDFEKWLRREIEVFQEKSGGAEVVSLPVVFHILHNNQAVGTGDNVSTALVNAQLEQLNNDFRRILGTSGFNNDPVGADTQIEFCMAAIDPQGNTMAEPGINRINTAQLSIQNPGYSINYMDNTVKPTTQWDPNQYINIWVTRINFFFGTILGYAQFPSQSGLPGLNNNEGSALSDGVVIRPSTVGSTDLPNPNGGVNARGRTLTHELGHFFGLRHIWGDGGCNADDFCADTPQSSTSTNGCPSSKVTCNTPDMIENYMDYTNDACMNIFTLCQKTRMQVVMNNSPRRGSLINSPACGSDNEVPPCELPYPQVQDLSANVNPNGSVSLSWNPIPGSLGCLIEGGLATGNGPVQSSQVFGQAPSSFEVPASLLQADRDYRWRVRCGCSQNPSIAGPWSNYAFFNTGAQAATGESAALRVETNEIEARVFPNPSRGLFNLELKGAEALVRLDIFNAVGQQVEGRQVQMLSSQTVHELDLQRLPKGMYLVKISAEHHNETLRIVIE